MIKARFGISEIALPRDFKKSLDLIVSDHQLQAVIMGTRRSDPYACMNE